MKIWHRFELNGFDEPWRHVWTIAGRRWCVGVSILTERNIPVKLVKTFRGENGSRILWLWRIGLGLRLARWAEMSAEDEQAQREADPDFGVCDRCGGDGMIEYNDGDGGDWGEDCPSEVNHLITCRACNGTGKHR